MAQQHRNPKSTTQVTQSRHGHHGSAEPKQKKTIHRTPEEYSEIIRNTKSHGGPFPAFLVQPKDVYFDAQDSEEKVLLLMRKHPITNLPWIFGVIIGLIAPVGFTFLDLFLALPISYQLVTVASWYMLVFGFGFEAFLTWYYHVFLITDERIIDYDFHSLLYKRVSKAKIDRIEDVTYQMGGVLQNVFHYGYVFVQTAGAEREFQFEAVPHPEKVVRLINELILEEEREKLEGRVR